MAFFKDGDGDHYVALRWFAEPATTPKGTVLELVALDLARDDKTISYSILPEKCIVNGAVMIKSRGTFWVVQSPREELAYARSNLRFQI
jgi:hypothetical protein